MILIITTTTIKRKKKVRTHTLTDRQFVLERCIIISSRLAYLCPTIASVCCVKRCVKERKKERTVLEAIKKAFHTHLIEFWKREKGNKKPRSVVGRICFKYFILYFFSFFTNAHAHTISPSLKKKVKFNSFAFLSRNKTNKTIETSAQLLHHSILLSCITSALFLFEFSFRCRHISAVVVAAAHCSTPSISNLVIVCIYFIFIIPQGQ
jgi:hypothetical protein